MPTRASRRVPPTAFRVIAEYTYDWETWVDARGRTRWINPAVERITGYSVAECLAKLDYPLDLVHLADRARVAKVLKSAAAGESGNDAEFRVRRKDGRICWVAVSWQAMRDGRGKSLGYRTSVRDIDDRKRMERQVDRLRRRAERAAQVRSELLANVSHELRSPAHCIAGFVELLAASDLAPRERHHVRVIADQATMMQRQVEDLLQIAALDVATIRMDAAPFDLRALLDSLIDAASLQASNAGLGLQLERAIALESPWVVGDRVRLSQVVRNLLDNALKFTKRGSIRVAAVRQKDGAMRIEVRDTGIGMTAVQLKQVTQPFFQADSGTDRRHGGVGLGLSIVERLVHAMGGRFELTSKRHEGTCGRVIVPLPATEPAVTEALAKRALPTHGVALVVDDSHVARELMVEWLRGLGWLSVTAASGTEALSLAKKRAFDVVLLDYQMPDLDGAQTALKLRQLRGTKREKAKHRTKRTRIVLVTANVFAREQLGRARDAIDQVLVKPVTREDLINALHGSLEAAATVDQVDNVPHAIAQTSDDVVNAADLKLTVVDELLALPSSKAPNLFAHLAPQTFVEQAEAFTELERAIEAHDQDGVERAAHRVAGLASVVGAVVAAQLARELMESAHEPTFEWDRARPRTKALREAWARAQHQLERILQR